MQFPTGGKAREPKGMIWCNSKADSIVWMKEVGMILYSFIYCCVLIAEKINEYSDMKICN